MEETQVCSVEEGQLGREGAGARKEWDRGNGKQGVDGEGTGGWPAEWTPAT